MKDKTNKTNQEKEIKRKQVKEKKSNGKQSKGKGSKYFILQQSSLKTKGKIAIKNERLMLFATNVSWCF